MDDHFPPCAVAYGTSDLSRRRSTSHDLQMQIRNSKLKYQAGYTHFCMVYPPWNEHTTWNTRLEDEFQFGKASYQMPCESFGECMGKVLFWNEDERNLELWNWNSKNKCEEYNTLKTLKWKVKTYTVYPIFGSFFVDSQQNNMFKWKSLNDLKDHLSQHHRHVTTPQLPPDQKPFSIFSRPLPAFPGTQRAGFFVGGSQDWW